MAGQGKGVNMNSEDKRFSFAIDQECIEFYDHDHIMSITTIEQTIQLKEVIKEAMFEWKKVNKKPLDYQKNPEKI